MKFELLILNTIRKFSLISPGQKILVAVSGGGDSLALLTILYHLRSTIGFQIHAAHINHQLRKDSQQDQRHVKKYCSLLNIPYSAKKIHLKRKIAQGGSIEEIAREARLKALSHIAKMIDADSIALGHHSDDLAETVLLRILRGTGLQGLQAILPKRTINGFVYLRPLLQVSRQDIQQYLKKNKIVFRTDPTNLQANFLRNKIRLRLLPYLAKNYQPKIKDILNHLATISGEDYLYLQETASGILSRISIHAKTKNELSLPLSRLKIYPKALQRMILRSAVQKIKGNTLALTLSHIQEIESLLVSRPDKSIVHLPYQVRVTKTNKHLVFR